jgi:hypothetical protein
VWLAVETTIIFFVYPETKGPMLEELAELFEQEDPLTKGQLDLEVGNRIGFGEEKGGAVSHFEKSEIA